jgi:hypothetical protein
MPVGDTKIQGHPSPVRWRTCERSPARACASEMSLRDDAMRRRARSMERGADASLFGDPTAIHSSVKTGSSTP